jgi:PAS domain S-box-containing protein
VAAFGITGPVAQTKPLARVAARLIDAWVADRMQKAQLRRSELKYRSIFEHSVQGIFQSTPEGRLLTANRALAALYGYASSEDLLAAMTDVSQQLYLQPEDRARFLRQLQENGQVTGFTTRYKRRDGRHIDVSLNAHLVADTETGAQLIEGIVEDITDRKQAEEALRVSEQKYFKAFENSPIWVVLSSLDSGRYIEVNKTFLRTMGYTREKIIGRTSLDIDSWVDPDERRRIRATLKQGGAVRNVEVRRRTPAGDVLTMLFSAEIIEVAGETCMLSVSQDISAQKQTEEELRFSENNLRITLNAIGDAVIATDDQGRITRMNPLAENLTGWPFAEAERRPLPEVFHIVNAHTREAVENPAAKVLAEGKLVGLANHTVLLARDGREYQIADSAAPIRGADGRVVGVVLVFRNVTATYEQERRIRENEALLKHLTANIPGVVYQFYATPDHRYGLRYLSEKAAEIFGIEAPLESYFEALVASVPQAEQAALLSSVRQAVETASPWHYEGRFAKPDGEIRWFTANAVPHRDGEDLVFDGVIMDTTDFKVAQEENLQRRQFLESVLYHAPDAIITLDAGHNVIDWNPGAVQMFGYTPEETFGRPLDELVARDDAFREAGEKTRQVLSGERVEAFETIRYRKDGSPVHVIAAGSPIMVADRLKGVVAVYTDISARKAAEARLSESHERFLTVLESIDATINVVDMETFEILYMNEKMKQVYGADLTGRTCWKAFRNAEGQCLECTYDQLIDPQGMPSEGCVWEGRNPVTGRWYLNYDRAIRWVDGRLVRLQVATDITRQKTIENERKGYEVRIQQMQKMEAIGMLAGGIAHDFNNILSAVIGYAELALIDTADNPRVHPNIRQIHAAGMRARDLVKQILTFSRQGEKELKPLQIGSQIKEALKMLRSSLPATIDIVSLIDPAVDNVMADPTQIHQIVMNLCTNAAQAMEESGGTLTVQLDQIKLDEADVRLHPGLAPGGYARLRVQDTGSGIPAEILDKIYDPYFTTKEKDKGTGLGLAVVHGIVKSYGGDITVDSAPGRGTTFEIDLPAIEAAEEPQVRPTKIPQGTERILLVDDEPFIVDFGRQGLERLGYRVDGCTSSAEALERFRRAPHRYDLVITDMTMPRMTGDQLAQAILRARPDLPVILCTGYSSRIDSRRAEAMGIRALLMKPLNLEDLATQVRRILDEALAGE